MVFIVIFLLVNCLVTYINWLCFIYFHIIMYSKNDFLKALDKEFTILKHLYSKVEQTDLDHQFTDKQRTIHQLLQYLAHAIQAGVTLVLTDDMSVFSDFAERLAATDVHLFPAQLDTQYAAIKTMVDNASEEALAQETTLFGRSTHTRMGHLVEFVYAQVVAYKMQLFLQLKHNGKIDLKSINLWA